ncbi:Dipeptide-binding protein [Raoultella terrigena]|uniref:Dipeptide-binding protein n=1 Tax=Raoultella terrigena TaxID=577 RepID=A0A3P8LXS7_RAOTE|nr:Dipeptide-binding protein [Raoultella terrigena]
MKEDKSITLLEQPGLNVGYLSFNTEKKPLDNLKVRQALTYAVNKEAIIKAVYQGAGQAAKNLIPPTMWGYNDDVKDYSYDPEKAKALLKEAGMEKRLLHRPVGNAGTASVQPERAPYGLR